MRAWKLGEPAILAAAILLLSGSCSFYYGEDANYYFFAYGVGDYSADANADDLANAPNDGLEVRELLTDFGMTKISSADGGTVTLSDIHGDLQNAADSQFISNSDIVIFYYAGHGFAQDGQTYLAPSNYSTDGDLSPDELWSALEALGAGHTIVILDACNSGGFVLESYGADGLPDSYEIPIEVSGDGNWAFLQSFANYFELGQLGRFSAMVASGEGEESFEWTEESAAAAGVSQDMANNGVFTGFLLESYNGDANGDGAVTLSEAYRYIFRGINRSWNRSIRSSNFASTSVFFPHISGGGIDPVLFRLD